MIFKGAFVRIIDESLAELTGAEKAVEKLLT
jgi:hypothetical protein